MIDLAHHAMTAGTSADGALKRCRVLKTECPGCNLWVDLPFQAGTSEVVCTRCARPVAIKDVHVSAGPFMIYRDALTGNLLKYKRLLAEAEKEIEDLRTKDAVTGSYAVSIRSLGLFISNLKELLDGCRLEPRHPLKDAVEAEYIIDNRAYKGKVANISLTGACLDTMRLSERTRLWSDISVRLAYEKGAVLIAGKIMWIGKSTLIGVKFTFVDEETREFLKDFITGESLLLGK